MQTLLKSFKIILKINTKLNNQFQICTQNYSKYKWLPKETSWVPEHISEKISIKTHIDGKLVNQLEHVSLVAFDTDEGVRRLDRSIRFADQLKEVKVDNIEPLITLREDASLYLRDDVVDNSECISGEIMKCASRTLEEYYIAPPGNIPMKKVKE